MCKQVECGYSTFHTWKSIQQYYFHLSAMLHSRPSVKQSRRYHEIFVLDSFHPRNVMGYSMLCNGIILSMMVHMGVRFFKASDNSRMREGGMNVCLSSMLLCQDFICTFMLRDSGILHRCIHNEILSTFTLTLWLCCNSVVANLRTRALLQETLGLSACLEASERD